MRKITLLITSIAFIIAFTGCSTLSGFMEETNPLPLFDEGATMYAHINVEGNESLIESIIYGNTTEIDKDAIDMILKRSTELYLAFYYNGSNSFPVIQLGLQGAFPTMLVNAALGESQGWQNESSTIDGAEYTYKKHATGIELSSISSNLVMVTTGKIAPIMDRYARGIENVQNWPVAYDENGVLGSLMDIFESSSSYSLYIPKIDTILPELLQIPVELPVKYAFGTITEREDSSMNLDLQLMMESERLASSTFTILRIATMASDLELELIDKDVIFIKNIPFAQVNY